MKSVSTRNVVFKGVFDGEMLSPCICSSCCFSQRRGIDQPYFKRSVNPISAYNQMSEKQEKYLYYRPVKQEEAYAFLKDFQVRLVPEGWVSQAEIISCQRSTCTVCSGQHNASRRFNLFLMLNSLVEVHNWQ